MHRSFFATKDAFINSGSDTINGEDFKNEYLGIIGMGNIGKKVAERANAF